MKIYTKTGDSGTTSLFGGQRVDKDHLRLEAFGNVDELNASLGVARSVMETAAADYSEIDQVLSAAQNQLFDLGAELATPEAGVERTTLLNTTAIEALELAIDKWDTELPPLKEFILPGGTHAAASLHAARCVCRRCERSLVTLMRDVVLRPELGVYLNRLGDLLFVLARAANHLEGHAEVPWQKGSG